MKEISNVRVYSILLVIAQFSMYYVGRKMKIQCLPASFLCIYTHTLIYLWKEDVRKGTSTPRTPVLYIFLSTSIMSREILRQDPHVPFYTFPWCCYANDVLT